MIWNWEVAALVAWYGVVALVVDSYSRRLCVEFPSEFRAREYRSIWWMIWILWPVFLPMAIRKARLLRKLRRKQVEVLGLIALRRIGASPEQLRMYDDLERMIRESDQ